MRMERLGVFGLAFALAACSGGGGGSGKANLGVTDAPVDDATNVTVEFTGVEVKPAGGDAIEFPFATPRQIDLLALEGGGSALLLNGVTLPAGDYEFVRLMVNAGRDASDSFIMLKDGTTHALFIPSGNESGLKLVSGFSIQEGQLANFTVDFDLRKSVRDPQGQDGVFILKPALRIVENSETGAISGMVDSTRATAEGCSPAVYIWPGNDAVTDDEGSNNPPITTALVQMDEMGNFTYTAAFLPLGAYTVAFTCQAAADDPATDDDITFESPTNATVTAGETTTVDFPATGP